MTSSYNMFLKRHSTLRSFNTYFECSVLLGMSSGSLFANLNRKTSFSQISWSLVTARLDATMIAPSWNLIGARQQSCRDACQSSERAGRTSCMHNSTSWLCGFARFGCLLVCWISEGGNRTVSRVWCMPFWLDDLNISWDCISRNGSWAHVTYGNGYDFSKAICSPVAQP